MIQIASTKTKTRANIAPVSKTTMGQRCPHGRRGNHKDKILGKDPIRRGVNEGGVNGGGANGKGVNKGGVRGGGEESVNQPHLEHLGIQMLVWGPQAGIPNPSCRRTLCTNALHFNTAQATGRCLARTEGQQQHVGSNV